MKLSENYRLKALDCERQARDAKDHDIKRAWADVAIEWHCLASRTAQQTGMDREVELS